MIIATHQHRAPPQHQTPCAPHAEAHSLNASFRSAVASTPSSAAYSTPSREKSSLRSAPLQSSRLKCNWCALRLVRTRTAWLARPQRFRTFRLLMGPFAMDGRSPSIWSFPGARNPCDDACSHGNIGLGLQSGTGGSIHYSVCIYAGFLHARQSLHAHSRSNSRSTSSYCSMMATY